MRCAARSSVRDLRALRARGMLLVLDNCEHVVDAAAELAGRLLRDCAGLRIIATSRQPLGVAGEALVPVPPLDVPDGVALFAARARAAAPGFRLDAGSADAVAEICRRLDGIPLALELAATRVPGLGVQAIVERLDDRFRLLDRDRRGGARPAAHADRHDRLELGPAHPGGAGRAAPGVGARGGLHVGLRRGRRGRRW